MQHINTIEPVMEVVSKLIESNPIIKPLTKFMIIGYLLTISLALIINWLEDKYGFGSFEIKEKTKDHLDEIDNFDNLNEIEEEYLIELKCKNCKGHLEIKNNYFECKYCDTKYIKKK